MKGLPKMRRVLYIFIACIMMFTLAACGGGSSSEEGSTQQENSQDGAGSAVAEDALVVYFSATGNTESVAEAIAETQGAELYEIVPEDPYTDEDLDYNNSSSRTTAEQNDENARPAISGEIENIDDYDVIYVGFPKMGQRYIRSGEQYRGTGAVGDSNGGPSDKSVRRGR